MRRDLRISSCSPGVPDRRGLTPKVPLATYGGAYFASYARTKLQRGRSLTEKHCLRPAAAGLPFRRRVS